MADKEPENDEDHFNHTNLPQKTYDISHTKIGRQKNPRMTMMLITKNSDTKFQIMLAIHNNGPARMMMIKDDTIR